MATQNYYFKSLEVKDTFKNVLEDIFIEDNVYADLGTEVFIISRRKKEKPTFPCIYIDTNSSENTRYASSTSIHRMSDFTLIFDIYSKDLENYSQDDAVEKIAEVLTNGIQRKYHCLRQTLNQPLPNLDETVSRWQVRFEGTMDNSNNFIYSN